MCGRFFIADSTSKNGIRDIVPTDLAWIVCNASYHKIRAKWGYYGRNEKHLIINARAESVRQKPLFGRDYSNRRCVVPAKGFYEWDGDRNRYLFYDGDGEEELYLAGIHNGLPVENKDAASLFTILTVEANEQMREVHSRMPVLIKRKEFARWFGTVEAADELLLEKIEGKQCLMKKRDLETEQKNGKIDVYVQQTLMDYLGGGLTEV